MSFGRSDQSVLGAAPVIAAAVRGFDLVVADVPRHLDDLGRELVGRSVLTVLVVPRRLTGIVAARGLLERLEPLTDAVVAVTRAGPGGPSRATVARDLAIPVVAELTTSRRLAADVEHGLGPMRARSVVAVARRILDTVGLR